VLIQLGAIPRHCRDLLGKVVADRARHVLQPRGRRFVIGVLVAFLPAAVIGAAAGGYIKSYLFNPWGGVLFADRRRRDPAVGRSASIFEPHMSTDATRSRCRLYLKIGFRAVLLR